jgi:hypothetical protein
MVWANSHGHGTLQLRTSNQSPETFQLGTFLLVVPDAVIRFDAKGSILAFYISWIIVVLYDKARTTQ